LLSVKLQRLAVGVAIDAQVVAMRAGGENVRNTLGQLNQEVHELGAAGRGPGDRGLAGTRISNYKLVSSL
jgi:hypothetical protein